MKVSKARSITGLMISAIPVLGLTTASMGKLMGNPDVVNGLSALNINAPLLGALLLVCLILYIVPKTSNIGFFLLCSYLGGVIVAELSRGETPYVGIGLSVMLYVGTMLRKPNLSGLGI